MEKYQPNTQEISNAVLPSPDAFAGVIADEILLDIKRNGRIISQQLLKNSILSGLAKLDLVSIADDSDTGAAQSAPFFEVNAANAAKEVFDKYFIE